MRYNDARMINGDRCKLSAEGIRARVGPRHEPGKALLVRGTVLMLRPTRVSEGCVRVLWDGHKWPVTLHTDFVERA